MHRTTPYFLTVILAIAGVTACSSDQPTGPIDAPLFSSAGASMSQPADHIEDFGNVPGAAIHAATLRRNKNNVTVQMEAWVPAPNTATVWGAIFNAPENCGSSPCSIDDLLDNPASGPSLLRAGGRVIGGNPVTITGQVREGDTSEALFGDGLLDAMTAEVHFVLRVHGPQIPTMVDDQIHYIDGGCGVNDCQDVGAAIFQPPI
jgi:hypothetical protein